MFAFVASHFETKLAPSAFTTSGCEHFPELALIVDNARFLF
jgi:hypothetical protein